MNSALNSDVIKLRTENDELTKKNRDLSQTNTKLAIKLKNVEIILIKYEDQL